jgi:exodeoxyribonuclease VII large subunit
MRLFLDGQVEQVDRLSEQLRLLHPSHQLHECVNRANQAQTQLVQLIRHAIEREEKLLAGLAGRLQALSPLAVLARGYSITLKLPSRHVVTAAASLTVGDALETLLAQGRVRSSVTQLSSQPPDSDAHGSAA